MVLLTASWHRRQHAIKFALATVGFAAVAATLRGIDFSACETIPFGTHYFWHIFLTSVDHAGVGMMVMLKNGTLENAK